VFVVRRSAPVVWLLVVLLLFSSRGELLVAASRATAATPGATASSPSAAPTSASSAASTTHKLAARPGLFVFVLLLLFGVELARGLFHAALCQRVKELKEAHSVGALRVFAVGYGREIRASTSVDGLRVDGKHEPMLDVGKRGRQPTLERNTPVKSTGSGGALVP